MLYLTVTWLNRKYYNIDIMIDCNIIVIYYVYVYVYNLAIMFQFMKYKLLWTE